MKNVYILFILALWAGIGYAQSPDLRNANWYFGNGGGVTFMPNGTSTSPVSQSATTGFGGSASVSDETGQLLFYTNGRKIWNKLHTSMPSTLAAANELNGLQSSSQNVVIIPRPSNPGFYYVVTINGQNGPLATHGLYYSQVDMSLDSNKGDITPSRKNVPLKDENGNDIVNYVVTEMITATTHDDGINYWLITQVNGSVYTFLVGANGITYNSKVTAPVYGTPYAGQGQVKISPNNQRIGIAYSTNYTYQYGKVALGTFDDSNGTIDFDDTTITMPSDTWSLEFSPSSSYVYITSQGTDYWRIYYTNSSTTPLQYITFSTALGGSDVEYTLQRGINGKIYGAAYQGFPVPTNLLVINNPNDPSNPGISLNSAPAPGTIRSGLPQLVPFHVPVVACESLTLNEEPNTTFLYDNRSDITMVSNSSTSYVLTSGKNINMRAQDFIVLKPNTHIDAGALYHAKIEECTTGTSTDKRYADTSNIATDEAALTQPLNAAITLYPNPASSRVSISATDSIKTVQVTSLDGKLMYSHNYGDPPNNTELDISSYAQGYYMVSITDSKGEIQTQKLIKN